MAAFAVSYTCDHTPDTSEVQGQSCALNSEDLKRMDDKGRKGEEEHVAQPRADNEPKYDKGLDRLEEISAQQKATIYNLLTEEKKGCCKTELQAEPFLRTNQPH